MQVLSMLGKQQKVQHMVWCCRGADVVHTIPNRVPRAASEGHGAQDTSHGCQWLRHLQGIPLPLLAPCHTGSAVISVHLAVATVPSNEEEWLYA